MNETKVNTQNKARARSTQKIVSALLELIHSKPYAEITVTEVCKAARVVRKTFYRNFESKDAVIAFRLDSLFAALVESYDLMEVETVDMLSFCYRILAADREFAVVFTDPTLYDLVVKKVEEYVETAYDGTLYNSSSFDPSLAKYYHTFIAVGVVSLVRIWVEGGFRQSVEDMAALSVRLLSGVK